MNSEQINNKLILVVGLQKSGTTLLQRLLNQVPFIYDPWFGREGNEFWGNTDKYLKNGPAGSLYLKHGKKLGHSLNDTHANEDTAASLTTSLVQMLPENCHFLLNKNPYNTVRLEWLKALFPNATIIAIARHPLSNAFSLTKRATKVAHRLNDGWFGVKPEGWRDLRSKNIVIQSAKQWHAVNRYLIKHQTLVNHFLTYDALCADPHASIEAISKTIGVELDVSCYGIPASLESFDSEYLYGSSLISKNKLMKKQNSFILSDKAGRTNNKDALPALTQEEIDQIKNLCMDTWQEIRTFCCD
jgi:hypothetical protein